jgi:hypothetical protein
VPDIVTTIQSNHKDKARALGSYRHDIPYAGTLKSLRQALALGSYRHDIAYTGALKSAQQHALGSYRQDVSYTAALKSFSACAFNLLSQKTGVKALLLTPVFFERGSTSGKHDIPCLSDLHLGSNGLALASGRMAA